VSVVEPRTSADIIRDLLEAVREREWVEEYIPCGRGCCGRWETRCAGCGKGNGEAGEHSADCRVAALIREVDAFLQAEEESS
jgi:hypothetical protein